MRSLWTGIAATSGARIYGLGASLVALILTARLLGPEGRGLLAALQAWAILFATVLGLSLGHVTQYRIQGQPSEEWLPRMFGTLLYAALALASLGVVIAGGTYVISGGTFFRGIDPLLFATGLLLLPLLIWDEYATNLLTAAGLLRVANVAQIIGKSFVVVGLFALVYWGAMGVFGAVLAQVLGQTVIAGLGIYALHRQSRGVICFVRSELRPLLVGSTKLHLNTIGAFLLGQATILMLNQFASKEETGWYQLAFQLAMIPLVIPQAVSAIFFEKMATIGPDRFWLQQEKIGRQILVIMLAMAGSCYLLAPWLIPLVAGEQFTPSVNLFRLLLPVQLCMGFAVFMTNQWIGRGFFALTTVITLLTGLGNILLNLLLIPRFGAVGAVWSLLASFVGISLCMQIWCVRYCRRASRSATQNIHGDLGEVI